MKKIPKIYFGWWINVVNAVLCGFSGGFRSQGFSALFKPIATELSLSRAAASIAPGISTLQNGMTFALAGWLSDRFGPKWVTISGAIVMGLGLVLMYFIQNPMSYYFVWGLVISAGATFGFSVSQDKMITDWFVKKRGLAMGVRFALMGVVSASMLPVISWLITTLGWRMTCLIWGGIIFSITPLMFYFVRQKRPEYYGLLPDGAKVDSSSDFLSNNILEKGLDYAAGFQETEFTLKEAMSTSTYWMLTAAWILHGLISQGFMVHCIPFLTDMGIDPVTAGGLMGLMIFFTIPSRFLGGIIADRFNKEQLKFLLSASFSLTSFGILSLFLGDSMANIYIFLIFLGLGSGSFIPLDIVIRGRYFGRKAYGSIQGSTAIITVPITFFSPIFTGWVYDSTGSYMTAFMIFCVIAIFSTLMMLFIKTPKLPEAIKNEAKPLSH